MKAENYYSPSKEEQSELFLLWFLSSRCEDGLVLYLCSQSPRPAQGTRGAECGLPASRNAGAGTRQQKQWHAGAPTLGFLGVPVPAKGE